MPECSPKADASAPNFEPCSSKKPKSGRHKQKPKPEPSPSDIEARIRELETELNELRQLLKRLVPRARKARRPRVSDEKVRAIYYETYVSYGSLKRTADAVGYSVRHVRRILNGERGRQEAPGESVG